MGDAIDLALMDHLSDQLDDLLLPWRIDLSSYHDIENPDLRAPIQRVGIVFYQKHSPR